MPSDSTATSPKSARQAASVFRLVVLHPPRPDGGTLSKVLERPLLISREPLGAAQATLADHDRLVLDDREISRQHARLERADDGGFEVHDLGSHNGTLVGGVRCEHARVHTGAVLRVGQHLLLLQELDAAAGQRLVRRRLPDTPIVGEGPACKWIDEQIMACATESAPVAILGESGTGKELVARQIHERSGRKGRFVPLNCTTLTESMADAELFGHAQGAFSGAVRARDGLFVEAHGGTLLLDEIGDMPLSIQAKLLRAIETGEVRKVGGDRAQQVDTRVLAATHVDLEAGVREGRFRGDLWARLQRWVVRLPPLRERRDDVLVLVRHFVRAAGSQKAISADAAEALVLHDWPYNVRELVHVVDAAVARAEGSRTIELAHLPEALTARFASRLGEPAAGPFGRAPESAEELERVLRQHDWNVTKVAALFGRDRKQIYRWCRALGIDLERSR